MSLILKIIAVILIHLAIFIGYPQTGAMGNAYLYVSLAIWIGLLIFFNMIVGSFEGMVSFVGHLIFFSSMILIILTTMPQLDKTQVIEKIFKKNFPTKESINHGLIKFGIRMDRILKQKTKKIGKEIDSALKELQKD